MKAIILIAGLGSRLGELTNEIPKCLTMVAGKEILVNALNVLSDCGFVECILVIGYKSDIIVERIGDRFNGMKISYVINPIYRHTSTSYSLYLGLKLHRTEDNIYIIEGDVFFEKDVLLNFINDVHRNVTVVDKYNPLYDGSFVQLNNETRVIDWIHKTKRHPDFTFNDKYKTVNIHKFSNEIITEFKNLVLEEDCGIDKRNYPLEYIMQEIILRNDIEMHAFIVSDEKWFEIDTAEELIIANEIFKIL